MVAISQVLCNMHLITVKRKKTEKIEKNMKKRNYQNKKSNHQKFYSSVWTVYRIHAFLYQKW